ncbi:MAG TPA: glutamine amidotransferase [Ruminiclostridium sp.]|nr:glutamine amidotransferase [Ruminiclostridium sp.]
MYELKICHLYPDLLNTYGDMGNILALKRRAQWRGLDVSVTNVTIGDSFDSADFDMVFLGGGQDYEQEIIQKDVLTQKGTEIKNAVEGNKVFLCICGGYQLMGKYYKTWDGKELEYLGALDLWTVGGKERMIGNIVFQSEAIMEDGCPLKIVGFENHSGRTYLGEGVSPLGKVLYGNGNNGTDGFEGAVYKNVYCSYSHGSLLPKNPLLADHLISLALRQKYSDFKTLSSLEDAFENAARTTMIQRILK